MTETKRWIPIVLVALAALLPAAAQAADEGKTRVDIYGFAMLDMGYQAGQNDPDWYDVLPVKHIPPDIDVIIITGYATVETAVETMKHGAMDYVQKPFTEDELLAFVKKALIRRQDRIQKLLQPRVHITHLPAVGSIHANEFSIPGGVFIAPGHVWATVGADGTASVGIDDFATKLIGPIEEIILPNLGMAVKRGQPLFSARRGKRRMNFRAPVSGKVVNVNSMLARSPETLSKTPYGNSWVCVIDTDNLDAELPGLKIGKSAVAPRS